MIVGGVGGKSNCSKDVEETMEGGISVEVIQRLHGIVDPSGIVNRANSDFMQLD